MFSCDSRRDGPRTVVSARGEIDLSSCDVFWAVLQPLIVPRAVVTIDCSELSFIDSQGVGILILAQNQADAAGAVLDLAAPSPVLLRVLDLVGITELFRLTPQAPPVPHAGEGFAVPEPAGSC